jgi:hypothetical protein
MDALQEHHAKTLDDLKKVAAAGVQLAIPAALHYCAKHGLEPPRWVVASASKLLCTVLNPKTRWKGSRSNGIVHRYRQDMIDYGRADCVEWLKERRAYNKEEIRELSRTPGDKAKLIREQFEMEVKQIGSKNDVVYDTASRVLRKTDARGSPTTIRASYKKVRKNSKDEMERYRYFVFDPVTCH